MPSDTEWFMESNVAVNLPLVFEIHWALSCFSAPQLLMLSVGFDVSKSSKTKLLILESIV